MTKEIASLAPEQALHAVLIFYDLLSDDSWENQTKPSLARMEVVADRLQENAPTNIQPLLQMLRREGDTERKGEVAKFLLEIFSQQESLRPYVDRAISGADEPHMAIDPVSIGIILIFLSLLSSQGGVRIWDKRGAIRFEAKFKGGGAGLVKQFTGFVSALPPKLLEGLK